MAVHPRRVQGLAPAHRGCRVLIVDDRETNRDLLCRMLSTLGFETKEACNGREGLELYTSWTPQVALVDLVMPVMDGREAIRAMREQAPGVNPRPCIVALTASTLPEERASVLAMGADAFLRKPFREEDLLEAIRIHGNVEYTYIDEVAAGGNNALSTSEARAAPSIRARLP